MHVGFIGLGRLGRPMATNLLNSGFDVTVYNRTQGKTNEMVKLGACASGTPVEVASSTESVHMCLPDVSTMENIVTGPGGVLEGAHPGLVLVDHSTVDPDTSRRVALAAEAKGVLFLDAPVSVTGDINLRDSITMMVGGAEAAFKQVLPVLEAEAGTIRWVGPVGSGSTAKLINNMIMGTNKVITMEAIVLGAKAGVDPSALYDIIQNASGASLVWKRDVHNFLTRIFTSQGAVRLLSKDMNLVGELATTFGLSLPIFEAAMRFWVRALEAGMGEEDPTFAVRLYEQAANLEIRGTPD
jgi:3-hydroxyisobutyrate dehydrogenase-like beta-hydroxyacid dehydrogenase